MGTAVSTRSYLISPMIIIMWYITILYLMEGKQTAAGSEIKLAFKLPDKVVSPSDRQTDKQTDSRKPNTPFNIVYIYYYAVLHVCMMFASYYLY